MALISGYSGSTFYKIGRSILLAVGNSIGVVAASLSGNATFDETSALVAFLDPNGSNRNVTAVASCEIAGFVRFFYNSGSANTLTIKSSAADTLATLAIGDWCVLFHTGSAWKVAVSQSLSSVLAAASSWTALQTFASGAALKDSVSYFYDDGDATKKLAFQVSGITAGTTRTLTAPDASGTLALLNTAQTWSAAQNIANLALTDNQVAALTIAEGANSYLTFKTSDGSETVEVGKPILLTGGLAPASKFTSTEQTGTGSSQNIAHGLGTTPSLVWAMVSNSGATGIYTLVPGAHDATNAKFTVTSGVKYYVIAIK